MKTFNTLFALLTAIVVHAIPYDKSNPSPSKNYQIDLMNDKASFTVWKSSKKIWEEKKWKQPMPSNNDIKPDTANFLTNAAEVTPKGSGEKKDFVLHFGGKDINCWADYTKGDDTKYPQVNGQNNYIGPIFRFNAVAEDSLELNCKNGDIIMRCEESSCKAPMVKCI